MSNLDYVNIEEKTVNIAVFNQTEAALSDLKIRFAKIPDCSTKPGYTAAKAGKSELTKYRSALENARKNIKHPYKTAGEIIDSVAKRIRLELEFIEAPLKTAIKYADETEARKKAERIARLQDKVDKIYAIELTAQETVGKNAVSELIESLNNLDVDNDYYDLTTQALDAKTIVLDRLANLYAQRLDIEVAEMQRVQAENISKSAVEENNMLRRKLADIESANTSNTFLAPALNTCVESVNQETRPDNSPDAVRYVTLTDSEYQSLVTSQQLLDALRVFGVAEWKGYPLAIQLLTSGAKAT